MRLTAPIILLPLVLAAAPIGHYAHAESDEAEAATADGTTKQEAVDPNKRVCKRVKPTGSHIAQRVCMKQSQWDAMAEEMRARQQRDNRKGTSPGEA